MQEQENQPLPETGATPSEAPAAAETQVPGEASFAEELTRLSTELDDARQKAQENFDALLRARADLDNVRRRAQEDVTKAHKFGIEGFAENLLPVMDSLLAALAVQGDKISLESYRAGIEITLRQLTSAFEKNRLVAIDPVGEKYDAHRHQAISMVPAPEGIAPNHVVTVLQKGYLIADRVLRPALVTVAQP